MAILTMAQNRNSKVQFHGPSCIRNVRYHRLSFLVYLLLLLLAIHKTELTLGQMTLSNNSNCSDNTCTENNSSEENSFELCLNASGSLRINLTLLSPLLVKATDICGDVSWTEVLMLGNKGANEFETSCRDLEGLNRSLALITQVAGEWESLLKRYDCDLPYSVSKNCTSCLVSYKRWLCMVSFYTNDQKPCLEVCNDVYRNCPSFEPEDSYRGYAVFECPEEGDQYSSYGPKSNCKTAPSLQMERK